MNRKKIKKLLIKTLTGFFVAAFLFLSVAPPARALDGISLDGFSSGVAEDMFDEVMDFLDVDQDELKDSVKTMNVSRLKKNPPEVSLSFSPANPAKGEKVTVTATPIYFMNSLENLYFTWFLKSDGCDEDDSPSAEEKEKCDLDGVDGKGDGDVDVEDYKIKAMRIIANDDFNWEGVDYSSPSGDKDGDGYEASFGGNDQKNKNAFCYLHNTQTGDEKEIDCDEHLFPNARGHETGNYSSGDKKDGFGRDEESFWNTDPNSEDTAHTGNVDEANVAGLGINNFTWNFEEGDEVGVVVEGISVEPTQESDSSYKTMWAIPGGTCDPDNFSNISKVSDLNDCLSDSLISPAENGPQSDELDVSLSYYPLSPINDKTEYDDSALSSGDELVVSSSILDAKDSNYVKYQWEVFAANEVNPTSWVVLTKTNLPGATQMTGLNLDTFKFKLNFKDPKKYLKIKLTVTENVGKNLLREGHSDVIIPINSTGSYIKVFGTEITGTSDPVNINLGTNELCDEGVEKALCPVSKNQIIGLSVPKESLTDFAWTIDGRPPVYQKDAEQNNEAFFAVLKEKGERYTVNLIATNEKSGEKVNLSRIFEVADPKISISSADENACKPVLLGYYIDIDGKEWPDYSKINFWGLSGYEIKLAATSSGFSVSPSDLVWTVDGNAVNVYNAANFGFSIDENGTLTLPAKNAGESYNVSASIVYTQSDLVKKALRDHWGVPYDQFYEKVIGESITITLQEFSPLYAEGKNPKVFAAAFSSLPAYLGFLLRITLTAFLIIFVARLMMSFFPRVEEKY